MFNCHDLYDMGYLSHNLLPGCNSLVTRGASAGTASCVNKKVSHEVASPVNGKMEEQFMKVTCQKRTCWRLR